MQEIGYLLLSTIKNLEKFREFLFVSRDKVANK